MSIFRHSQYTYEYFWRNDKLFEKNNLDAKAAGLNIGVYYYTMAINTQQAKIEADYLLKVLNKRRCRSKLSI